MSSARNFNTTRPTLQGRSELEATRNYSVKARFVTCLRVENQLVEQKSKINAFLRRQNASLAS